MPPHPILANAISALRLDEVGDPDDLGCVACGKREPNVEEHSEALIFDLGGRYWHALCACRLLSEQSRRHGRPSNFAELPPDRQWEIDKELGLLDEPVDEMVAKPTPS